MKPQVETKRGICYCPTHCRVNIDVKGDELLADEYILILEIFPHPEVIPVDAEVADLAPQSLEPNINSGPYAVQFATSILKDTLAFVTNGKSLNKVKEIESVVMR